MNTVGCSVALFSSLDSLSANATDNVHYIIDVGNCFSSLPIENTPVMVFNVDRIPAVTLHETVAESSISGLAGEAITAPTYMMFLLMELPLNLSFPWVNENSFHLLVWRTLVDLQ